MLRDMAIFMIVFFLFLAVMTHFLLSVAKDKRLDDSFPKSKAGKKLIWRLNMSYLIEGCGLAAMNFLFILN